MVNGGRVGGLVPGAGLPAAPVGAGLVVDRPPGEASSRPPQPAVLVPALRGGRWGELT